MEEGNGITVSERAYARNLKRQHQPTNSARYMLANTWKTDGVRVYRHVFDSANLGTVKAQEVANGPYQEFKLLKTSKSPTPQAIEKIKVLSFPVLKPLPMELKRQEYLYHNIRLFVRDEFKDITCPKPTYTGNK